MALKFGEQTYRQGAEQRLEEARRLLDDEHFGGSVYLAGRAVEGMLRGLIWRQDDDVRSGKKSLDTGHDLRHLLTEVRRLGLLGSNDRDITFMANVQQVARLWSNNLRFASSTQLQAHWRSIGELQNKHGMKAASQSYYEACVAVVKRCETLWRK